jgi:iron(III) transport system substrate-binding protein
LVRKPYLWIGAALVIAVVLLVLFAPRGGTGVVVYTSVDPEYAKALAERFSKETGVSVELRTDSESSKTTGLVSRLRTLENRPDGDVFWNSELSWTLLLANEGLFDPYLSPQGAAIPAEFKDAGGLWTGFGCRARVLIYNTRRVKAEEAPKFLEDLADPKWRGRFCIARPLFGTTRSHLVSLVLAEGEERGLALLRRLAENASAGRTRKWITEGNASVRDRVAEGTFDMGLTDTDDVFSALRRNLPVGMVYLEQTRSWPGVFLIPNTVSVIKRGPHPEAARKFVDFLLRPETEAWLAQQGARQIPVRAEVPVPSDLKPLGQYQAARVDGEGLRSRIDALGVRIHDLFREYEAQ